MAVTFHVAGAAVANFTTTTLTLQTFSSVSINDILIAVLINKSTTANAISAPDGTWTQLAQGTNTGGTGGHQYAVFWKRTLIGGLESFDFTKATDDNSLFYGIIGAFSGAAKAPLSPIDVTAVGVTETTASSDNVSFPAFDPTRTDVHVVFAALYGNDLTTFAAAMSSDTNPDCTKRFDVETSTGTDASLALTSGDNDGANIAARTWASASTADAANTGVVFALVPLIQQTKTQTAVARITVQTTKTQTAIARITDQVSQIITAKANIATGVQTTQTQTARARITDTVDKTQTALARITDQVSQTQTARARITDQVSQTQTALARITDTVDKTQTAIARITDQVSQTQTALARITNTVDQTQTAIARITDQVTQTITAKAAMLLQQLKTQTAKARINGQTTQTITAKAFIGTLAEGPPVSGATSYSLGLTVADIGAQINPEHEAALRRGDLRWLPR